jgi:hypothetical protein
VTLTLTVVTAYRAVLSESFGSWHKGDGMSHSTKIGSVSGFQARVIGDMIGPKQQVLGTFMEGMEEK